MYKNANLLCTAYVQYGSDTFTKWQIKPLLTRNN